MRILIAGGTGLIGQALAVDLHSAGHHVVVLSRDPARAKNLPDGVQIERWDARTADGWGHLAEGAAAVVNLAGESIGEGRWTPERKRRIRESRLDAGQAVVQAVDDATDRPGVVVQASGIGFYGDSGDIEVTEEAPAGHGFLAGFAVEWENSTAHVQDSGVRWAAIRTGIVLSSSGGALGRLIMPVPLVSIGRLGGGRQWFPWIHVADQIGAIRFLIEKESARGPFNLSAPNSVTNAEFCQDLRKALGRPVGMPIPSRLLRLLLGELATELLCGQRAVPQRLLQLGFTFRFPDVDAALQDLLRQEGQPPQDN